MWHGKWRDILGLIPRETLIQNLTLFFRVWAKRTLGVLLCFFFSRVFSSSLFFSNVSSLALEKWKNVHLQKISMVKRHHHKVFVVKGFHHPQLEVRF
jgi:hypothetical protein